MIIPNAIIPTVAMFSDTENQLAASVDRPTAKAADAKVLPVRFMIGCLSASLVATYKIIPHKTNQYSGGLFSIFTVLL